MVMEGGLEGFEQSSRGYDTIWPETDEAKSTPDPPRPREELLLLTARTGMITQDLTRPGPKARRILRMKIFLLKIEK